MKILIIEDNSDLASGIETSLSAEGYICEVSQTIEHAAEKIQLYDYECILLDISLPDGSGLTILEKLKKLNKQDGVIIISAKDSLDDKLKGLVLGADDYLTKPFHLAELTMRVLAVIRRRSFNGNNLIKYGGLSINLIEKNVFYLDTPVKQLSPKEYDLLLFFMSAPKRVLTKGTIAEHLLGDHADLFDNFDIVYAHVKNLKKKLKQASCPDYIKTIYGMGYKFENRKKMKLLHKTLRLYLLFSVIIFISSIPVFYFLIQDLWINDVDESLIYQKKKIAEGLKVDAFDLFVVNNFTKDAERFDLGVSIFPLENFHPDVDSLYNNAYLDPTRQHVEPFRELTSIVTVNGKTYKIIVRKDLVESADLIREIFFTQAILFLILLAGVLIFNSYFSKKTWQPFYAIVSGLKSFRIDKQIPLVASKGEIEEFNELGDAIQRLTENNIRSFRSQKEFTENAAHETQTPLAVIKNQLDLMAQDSDLTFPQSEIITRIDKNIRVLTRLNRNLLLLAKIENEQYAKTDTADISAITSEICSAFDEQIKIKGIDIIASINAQVYILSNSYLIHSLVTNLLTNAIKYNIPHGRIEVVLTGEYFKITNTGLYQPLDKGKIYERFYKNSNTSNSSGLGLAIVKKICDALNYTSHYQYAEPNMHSFTIKFP